MDGRTLQRMIHDADKGGYAIPSFNYSDIGCVHPWRERGYGKSVHGEGQGSDDPSSGSLETCGSVPAVY